MLHATDASGSHANERCAVLIGGQRHATILRSALRGRFVIAGWPGLALGTRLHLILDRGRSVVQECEVIGATALGIELARVEGAAVPDGAADESVPLPQAEPAAPRRRT
ncbi:hypothetical protein [Roseomonas fluvialis]|uniref:Ferrous iron transport protein A n=1 Tax=Roseomonas fluvialis TaxID=1750527 RepID=A0ABM7Y334_9PROT|nr:hypothetical protein [Roseomonas fluvialis]BDG72234.1 hypothetical protein Rmf_21630 [Roseomonas fluvialis]